MIATKLSLLSGWKKLEKHYKAIANTHMRELFKDHTRAKSFSIEYNDIYVDFSKHRINTETLDLLIALADEAGINNAIKQLFNGVYVNVTEKRPALHTALRSPKNKTVSLNGENISDQIHNELSRMNKFVNQVHAGDIKGYSGKAIDTLINIGIGGSDLGPRMVTQALDHFANPSLNILFVANVDATDINDALSISNPETTLFIVSSKSFTTKETLANANTARNWLIKHGCNNTSKHFIAVSANMPEVLKFGIDADRCFHIWEWVGGRYSVWSAIGLPIAASIGMENFREFLGGAHTMDEHFRTAPLTRNIPVILAMLDIWYINFFNAMTLAIIPYDQSLKMLPEYLGQLIMESNGKSVTQENNDVDYHTSPIIWGGVGTNAQHAFFQLLHQGTRLVPVDLLASMSSPHDEKNHHRILLANCIAQGEALMLGNVNENTQNVSHYKFIAGNKPSTTILYESLTPATLGALLAMYEHRTYIQGCIWNINSFDQWGVELGKTIADSIANELKGQKISPSHDASTLKLIERYRDRHGD